MSGRKFLYPLLLVIFILAVFLTQCTLLPSQLRAEESSVKDVNSAIPQVTPAPADANTTTPQATSTPNGKKEWVGNDICLSCHSDMEKDWKENVHAKLPEGSYNVTPGCESCHGPGSLHAGNNGDISQIQNLSKLSPEESSAVCYKCHSSTNKLMKWHSSEHYTGNVACIDCHDVHKKHTRSMLKKEDPDLCYDCHTEQKIQANLPSHHPINSDERSLTFNCGTCHNSHDNMLGNLTDAEVRDQCLSCHGDKGGPFMNEHAPVAENCLTCHQYLGSENNNLLRFSEPFLCLQCHDGTHVFKDANSNTFPHDFTGDFGVVSGRFYTQCTNCHTMIHGSDDDDIFLR